MKSRIKIKPTLDIFRNKETGNIIIANSAMNPVFGAATSWGPLVRIDILTFERASLGIILENLMGFHDRLPDRGEFSGFTPKEYASFVQGHNLVVARLDSEQTLVLTPMHQLVSKGYQSALDDSERVYISLPLEQEEFHSQLLQIFAKC